MKKEDEKKITEDMPIGDIIKKVPGSEKVMFEHGLHCIGCRVAEWETLKEGCKVHGIDDKKIKEMVRKINSLE